MAIAEKKRLLYVAMTRARDYLALFMDHSGQESVSFQAWVKSVVPVEVGDDPDWQGQGVVHHEGQAISYSVQVVSDDRIDRKLKASVNDLADHLERAAPVFDLMQPQAVPRIPASIRWTQLQRITPAFEETRLEPVVLGNYFHLLMEGLAANLKPPQAEMLENLALSEQVQAVHGQMRRELVEEASELLEIFFKSPLCVLMEESVVRLHEPPYVVLSQSESESSKRPDLLLKSKGGQWFVIDYKTDHFPLKDLQKQAGSHAGQLERYVADVEFLTGIKPVAAIYFAQHGLLHEINC